MMKHGVNQDALIQQFSQATARQGEALRKAVHETTLKALQGRALTLANIRQVLRTVAQAASAGAAANPLGADDVEALLTKAVSGMDGALEQAVQAHRKALQQMVDQGASLRETQVKKALADIEKMEDTLFTALQKAAADADKTLQAPWAAVLKGAQGGQTATGSQASAALAQLMAQARDGMREGRALGVRATQALLDGYATLASGVLIGMTGALEAGSAQGAAPAGKSRKR